MPRSSFPGMDPSLEAPDLWQDVHTRFKTGCAEQLTPQLAPGYVAEVLARLAIDRLMDKQPQIIAFDAAVVRPGSRQAAAVLELPYHHASCRLKTLGNG